jgi:primosomal protein N' (replication factor Y)
MRMIEFGQIKKIPVLVIDADITKNETEERELLEEMGKKRPAIFISTQSIFSHRYEFDFPTIGLINFDALINFSDFRTEERAILQIRKMMDFNPKNLVIQTYDSDSKIGSIMKREAYKSFLEEEASMRKILGYPPFKKIIKLIYRHKNKDKVLLAGRVLSEKLHLARTRLNLNTKIVINDSSPLFLSKERNMFRYDSILKIDNDLANLREFLKYVPSAWSIEVSPNNIF